MESKDVCADRIRWRQYHESIVNQWKSSVRRAGTTFTIDELNKYFTIAQMPLVSSAYWNMVHGNCREEVLKDEEGLQKMRNLAKNMAWLMQCIQCGKEHGIALPEAQNEYRTNFIR